MTTVAVAALALGSTAAHAVRTKNVIVMIADGAGYNTLEATRFWTGSDLAVDGAGWRSTAMSVFPLRTSNVPVAGAAGLAQDPNTVYNSARAWDTTPVAGNSTVPGFESYAAGFQGYEFSRATYPDSGNTATSIATGIKTYNNAINVDGNGNPVRSLAEVANRAGKTTGVVSTVQFGDATPAALGGAHNVARSNRTAIAQELFSSGTLDVIAGTGNPDYDDNGQLRTPAYTWATEAQWGDLKAGTNVSGIQGSGEAWTLLQDRASIDALAAGGVAPEKLAMIMQADQGHQEYRDYAPGTDLLTYEPGDTPFLTTSPTLTNLSLAALSRLNQGDEGLYIAIEGGGVDRAMHANSFGRMIEEYIEFNRAVADIKAWVESPFSKATWDDTVLIVTADHDHNLYGPDGATIPFQNLIDNGPGNLPGYAWFGATHSNNLIPLFAYGRGADEILALADQNDSFNGFGRGAYTDQAELGQYLLSAAGVPEPGTWAMLIAGFGFVGGAMRRRSGITRVAA